MFFYNVAEKELFNLLFHMTISPSINNLIYYFNLPHTSKAPKHQHLTLNYQLCFFWGHFTYATYKFV